MQPIFSDFCFHDARISKIQYGDSFVRFLFPDGVCLIASGTKSGGVTVRLPQGPEDVAVYFSKRLKLMDKDIYLTVCRGIEDAGYALRDGAQLEIMEAMEESDCSYLWRCVLLTPQGYRDDFWEFQFKSDAPIAWEVSALGEHEE